MYRYILLLFPGNLNWDFHEIAAMHYFDSEEIEIVPRNTFKDLFKSLKMRQVDYGIMAIENSLAGSILPNYALNKQSIDAIKPFTSDLGLLGEYTKGREIL
jgi:prephenate dehydratase